MISANIWHARISAEEHPCVAFAYSWLFMLSRSTLDIQQHWHNGLHCSRTSMKNVGNLSKNSNYCMNTNKLRKGKICKHHEGGFRVEGATKYSFVGIEPGDKTSATNICIWYMGENIYHRWGSWCSSSNNRSHTYDPMSLSLVGKNTGGQVRLHWKTNLYLIFIEILHINQFPLLSASQKKSPGMVNGIHVCICRSRMTEHLCANKDACSVCVGRSVLQLYQNCSDT